MIAIIFILRKGKNTTPPTLQFEHDSGDNFAQNFDREDHLCFNSLAESRDSDASEPLFQVHMPAITE
jgi:hypothetical protein